MLSVITSLEFFQHYLAKMGHRNTSCDPHLHQTVEQPTLHHLTRSVRRRAATSKRGLSDKSPQTLSAKKIKSAQVSKVRGVHGDCRARRGGCMWSRPCMAFLAGRPTLRRPLGRSLYFGVCS